MEHKLRRLDRTLAYKGGVLTFYRDTMELPDGKIEQWDFIDHPRGGACIVPVLPDGRILMIHQMRPAIEVAYCSEFTDVYLAEDLVPADGQHLDEAEEINVEAFELETLMEKIYAGEIQDAKTVAGIMAYAAKIGRDRSED